MVAMVFFDFNLQGIIALYYWMVISDGFDVQHWHDGGRNCQELRNCRYYCKHIVLFDADFFRGNSSIRSNAEHYAACCGYFALAQGIKILKSATLNLPMDSSILPIIIMVAIAGFCSFIAIRFFKWE